MNNYTEEEAKNMFCPLLMITEKGPDSNCFGRSCVLFNYHSQDLTKLTDENPGPVDTYYCGLNR